MFTPFAFGVARRKSTAHSIGNFLPIHSHFFFLISQVNKSTCHVFGANSSLTPHIFAKFKFGIFHSCQAQVGPSHFCWAKGWHPDFFPAQVCSPSATPFLTKGLTPTLGLPHFFFKTWGWHPILIGGAENWPIHNLLCQGLIPHFGPKSRRYTSQAPPILLASIGLALALAGAKALQCQAHGRTPTLA